MTHPKTTMRLGYNTNGFAHHRIEDALEILAEIGYQTVAVTLEHDFFDPPDERGVERAFQRLQPSLERTGMAVTIETGSRFILDPRRKHQPTLVSRTLEDRRTRIGFLRGAVELAARLSAESVSLWSGATDDPADPEEALARLRDSVGEILKFATPRGVRLAFEPEPGMLIDTMTKYSELSRQVNHPLFGLTLDLGHVHCLGDGTIENRIREWKHQLCNVHIEDMRRGAHEHLMFGDGEMDFAAIRSALRAVEYAGPVHVELSRHSHDAVKAAKRAYEFLSGYFLE